MITKFKLIPIFSMFLFSLSTFSLSKSVVYSESADVFEIIDQISEWSPMLPKDILHYWKQKFGDFSSTDQSYLNSYQSLRQKLAQQEEASLSEGDKFLGQINPLYDYFSYSFYSSNSVAEALKKLSKKLSKDEVDLLSKMLKHFLPKISQLVSESTSFRQKAKDWETKLRKQKIGSVVKDLERFVNNKKRSKSEQVQVILVWWPMLSKPKIDVRGKYILVRHHPLKEFDDISESDLLGPMILSYLASQSPNFKNNLAKAFQEKCPGRQEEFKESFVTVYRNIKFFQLNERKKFTIFKEWSSKPFINTYARLLFLLIDENQKKKLKIEGDFIHQAAQVCRELHSLAVSV